MNRDEHIEIHKGLFKALDKLLGDFIQETHQLPSETTLMEFLDWTKEQTINPSDRQGVFTVDDTQNVPDKPPASGNVESVPDESEETQATATATKGVNTVEECEIEGCDCKNPPPEDVVSDPFPQEKPEASTPTPEFPCGSDILQTGINIIGKEDAESSTAYQIGLYKFAPIKIDLPGGYLDIEVSNQTMCKTFRIENKPDGDLDCQVQGAHSITGSDPGVETGPTNRSCNSTC